MPKTPRKLAPSKTVVAKPRGTFPPMLTVTPNLYAYAALLPAMADFYQVDLDDLQSTMRYQDLQQRHLAGAFEKKSVARKAVYGADDNRRAKDDEAVALRVRAKASGVEFFLYHTLLLWARDYPAVFSETDIASEYNVSSTCANFVLSKLLVDGHIERTINMNYSFKQKRNVLFNCSTWMVGRDFLNAWGSRLLANRPLSCKKMVCEKKVTVDARRCQIITRKLDFTTPGAIYPRKLEELEGLAQGAAAEDLVTVATLTYFAPHILPGESQPKDTEEWRRDVHNSSADVWGYCRVLTATIRKEDLKKLREVFAPYQAELDQALVDAEGVAADNRTGHPDYRDFRVVSALIF